MKPMNYVCDLEPTMSGLKSLLDHRSRSQVGECECTVPSIVIITAL